MRSLGTYLMLSGTSDSIKCYRDHWHFCLRFRNWNADSAGAAAAPARDLSPDEEKTTLNLFQIVNGKISDRVTPLTLSYKGQELTVLSLHWNGIHCRDEQGAAVIVPGEWEYLKEVFIELD